LRGREGETKERAGRTSPDRPPSLLSFFEEKKKVLLAAGIERWVIDPGFGFGKTIEENFKLVRELANLKKIGLPILLGASRKSSIYKTLGVSAEEALNGTSMVNTVALLNEVNILRVHDVKEAVELVQLLPHLK
jgi:dihydropteroate synthase